MNQKIRRKITNLTIYKNIKIKSIKIEKKFRKNVKLKPIRNGLIVTIKVTKGTVIPNLRNGKLVNYFSRLGKIKITYLNGQKEYTYLWMTPV
jgi:hypothetical protein